MQAVLVHCAEEEAGCIRSSLSRIPSGGAVERNTESNTSDTITAPSSQTRSHRQIPHQYPPQHGTPRSLNRLSSTPFPR